jgi:hypothetical protein
VFCPKCNCVDDCRCRPELYFSQYSTDGVLIRTWRAISVRPPQAEREAALWARGAGMGGRIELFRLQGYQRDMLFQVKNMMGVRNA